MPDSSQVRAAGAVLWRRVDDVVQVALVHRPKYDDWSLPKGKLEPGEPAVVGGVREVCEETGFGGVVGRTLGVSRYRVLQGGRDVEKTVQWWAMRAGEGEFVPGPEVDAMRWLPVRSALARVSGGYDCGPLQEFSRHPVETTTVLLVRHGSAGRRSAWEGPDEQRPLDEQGRVQARVLADVLPLYAPARVLAAPLARCLGTVRPAADRIGLEVEQAAAATEQENAAAPGALVALVREVARGDEAAVVCSQGGAIPGAVAALTGDAAVPASKGSLWALTFAGDRLLDAAHTAPAED